MAIVAAVAAVVGASVAVAGTALSARAQSKAAKAQRQQRNLEAGRKRRDAVRRARIERGRIENAAALGGTTGSSSAVGAVGSLSSQLVSNLSFLDQGLALENEAAKQQSSAATFGAISRIGSSIFSAAGGATSIARAVKPPAPMPTAGNPITGNPLAGAFN